MWLITFTNYEQVRPMPHDEYTQLVQFKPSLKLVTEIVPCAVVFRQEKAQKAQQHPQPLGFPRKVPGDPKHLDGASAVREL